MKFKLLLQFEINQNFYYYILFAKILDLNDEKIKIKKEFEEKLN